MIHEVKQVMWIETPHGLCQVLFLIDYGPHQNTVWVAAAQTDGAIRHYDSNQIRLAKNHTFEIGVEKMSSPIGPE